MPCENAEHVQNHVCTHRRPKGTKTIPNPNQISEQQPGEKFKLIGELGLVTLTLWSLKNANQKAEIHSVCDDSHSRHKVISMHFLKGMNPNGCADVANSHKSSIGLECEKAESQSVSKMVSLSWDQLLNIFIEHPNASELEHLDRTKKKKQAVPA